jgi:hypothetical protein
MIHGCGWLRTSQNGYLYASRPESNVRSPIMGYIRDDRFQNELVGPMGNVRLNTRCTPPAVLLVF